MSVRLSAPIGILDEHPEWSARLIAELEHRRLPFEKIDHSNHAFDPRDRVARYSVIVNRTSPSSHRRGHGGVLFYAEALLAHWEALGIPVINPVHAYRFEKSKALQIGLFERLGVNYPRTVVVNHRDQVLKASGELRFPLLVKPNIGGSGALIERFDSRADLEARAAALDFGPDGTGIVRPESNFNLCPADICQVPAAAPGADLGACPVDAKPGLSVTRYDAPEAVVDQARALARAASIDVGGIEYLVGRADGRVYFYDVNATSNFVADAPAVLGFDPFPRFVDYIVRVATARA
jgi:hypothetical protein